MRAVVAAVVFGWFGWFLLLLLAFSSLLFYWLFHFFVAHALYIILRVHEAILVAGEGRSDRGKGGERE
jgi:hypothetical protein